MSPNDKITSLAERRAQTQGDCRAWTLRDMLQAAISDIDQGLLSEKDMGYLAIRHLDENGLAHYHYYAAGANNCELHGLLAIHLKRL